MSSFSDIAVKEMISLSSNTKNKVGRELYKKDPVKYKGFIRTDCSTFVLNVLKHTYDKLGNTLLSKSLTKHVAKRGKDTKPIWYGDLMFKDLVRNHGWKAIYLTPDKWHPNDGSEDHTFATSQVLKTGFYAGIPVSYTVLNYNPTPKTHPKYPDLLPYLGPQKINSVDLAALNKIKFGVGMSSQGDHNWLFSNGSVYEVHWEGIGAGLYEIRKIPNFPWNSNLIIVPPDMLPLLTMSALVIKKKAKL
jgi:hypothetical protein